MKNSVNYLITFSILFGGIVVCEYVAGRIWDYKYEEWLKSELHGYDYLDEERNIILPIPGVRYTYDEVKRNLKKHKKDLGLKYLEKHVRAYGQIEDSTQLFKINSKGFKGPEFKVPKGDGVCRILTIGNSCTWGPNIDFLTYPRIMESEMNRLDSTTNYEVVNAGVQGYNFQRSIKRMDEYLDVDPDLVTIYLGWNQTIGRADPNKNMFLYRNTDLYKILYHGLINRQDVDRVGFMQNTYFDSLDTSIEQYKNYQFKYDVQDLHHMVSTFQRNGIRVVIITIAGLFDDRVVPSPDAVIKANPIASHKNLFVYSILTRRYNEALRNYASEHSISLIDFESYALGKFMPRSDFYSDSIHPVSKGYTLMGEFFAVELLNIIKIKSG